MSSKTKLKEEDDKPDEPLVSFEDTTLKNIVKEILRECTHKGMEISASFISYYVNI